MGVLTSDVGFSLEDLSVVEVDGLAPSAFAVDTLYVPGQMWFLGIGFKLY